MSDEWYSNDEMRAIFDSVKNWGRWGADDEAGALNLITADARLAATREVVAGEPVSCARELPVKPNVENPHPAMHMMVRGGDDCMIPGLGMESTSDFVGVQFHGMATSHIDALCHVFVDQQMYNGFPATDVKSTGAQRGSIMCAKDGVVGRGVLLDIPRLHGVDFLEPDTAVTIADLEAAEADHGVAVGSGDIVLVATGRDARRAAVGPWHPFTDGLAGLHPECIPWLHEREIAVLGSDGVSDVLPGKHPTEWVMPLHQCVIVAMGVHLLDNLRLDSLSEACARHQQWSFLFTVAPLRIRGGTGSPVNPIALLWRGLTWSGGSSVAECSAGGAEAAASTSGLFRCVAFDRRRAWSRAGCLDLFQGTAGGLQASICSFTIGLGRAGPTVHREVFTSAIGNPPSEGAGGSGSRCCLRHGSYNA